VDRDLLIFAATAFGTIFAIVDPFAAVPVFLAMTPQDTPEQRRKMARLASIITAGVLLVFAFTGNLIFNIFGITPPAFRVAGGVLLMALALDMMRAKSGPSPQAPEEKEEGLAKADVAVTPLAIPLLAGPGAMSTCALLGSTAKDWLHRGAVGVGIVVTSLGCWIILANSDRLIRVIGQIGVRIVTRIMGLLLAGMGAQFILAGVSEFIASLKK
jgi:multiple antibiotic resistance protein